MSDKGKEFNYIQKIALESGNSLRKITKYFSKVERFSKKTEIFKIIFKNIAPFLFRNEVFKKVIDLVMFGGSYEVLPDMSD